jgi:hypothetical protein
MSMSSKIAIIPNLRLWRALAAVLVGALTMGVTAGTASVSGQLSQPVMPTAGLAEATPCPAEPAGAATPEATPTTATSVRISRRAETIVVTGAALSADLLEDLRSLPCVVTVEGGVVGEIAGEPVVGIDPLPLSVREIDSGERLEARIVEGRDFVPDDVEQTVAVVGREFATAHETGFGYPILGMVDHAPPVLLGDAEFTVVGIFESESEEANAWVYLPLGTAQRLLGKQGEITHIYLDAESEAAARVIESRVQALVAQTAAPGAQETATADETATPPPSPTAVAGGGMGGMGPGMAVMGHARVTPTEGPAPLTVEFFADAIGDVASTRWEFGDGTGSDEMEPRHTYQAPGVYRATFTVTDRDGWVDQSSVRVTVLPASGEELVGWPSVRLTSPDGNHQTLRGTVEAAVEASENVVRVEYYLGPKLLRTETAAPFAWRWDTRAERNAMYYLTAVAYDAEGRLDISSVMVNVEN